MFPPDVIYVFNFADKKQRCFAHTQYYTAVFVICKYDFTDNPANFWLFRAFFIHILQKAFLFTQIPAWDLANLLANKDALCYYYKVEIFYHPKSRRSAFR